MHKMLLARTNTSVPLSDQLFEYFAHRIINGDLVAGDSLPPEREMAERFGVNRHVIREAVKRAQRVGLVSVVRGGGTRVLDTSENAGLGLLELLALHVTEGALGHRYWLSIAEMRVAIASDIARQCAERAPRELKDELLEIVQRMRAAMSDDELLALDERFWLQATRGSDNLVYRMAFNTLLTVSEVMRETSDAWTAQELRAADFQSPVADAISRADAEAAAGAVRKGMQSTIVALKAMSATQVAEALVEARAARAIARPMN